MRPVSLEEVLLWEPQGQPADKKLVVCLEPAGAGEQQELEHEERGDELAVLLGMLAWDRGSELVEHMVWGHHTLPLHDLNKKPACYCQKVIAAKRQKVKDNK